jgi:hypothetical protein
MAETEPSAKTSRPVWTGEGVRWIIVTLLIPFAGFVWDRVQEREAERQEKLEIVRADQQARIENARSESDIVIQLLPALGSSETNSPLRGIALAILLNLADREALSPELVSAVQVAIDTAQQRVRAGTASVAERAALDKIAAASDQPDESSARKQAPLPITPPRTFRLQVPRVYIHLFDESDRKAAIALETWIRNDQHWLAPGIENVVASATRASKPRPAGNKAGDVRYFNEEDRVRAEEIANWLRRNGTPSATRLVTKSKAPAGQIEVWFPNR